jgi:hypothetical protein
MTNYLSNQKVCQFPIVKKLQLKIIRLKLLLDLLILANKGAFLP